LSWFDINLIVADPTKFQMMFSGKNIDNNFLSIECNGVQIYVWDWCCRNVRHFFWL